MLTIYCVAPASFGLLPALTATFHFFILCIYCVPCGFRSYEEGELGVGGGDVPVFCMTRTWGVRCFFMGTLAATVKAPAFSEF